MNGSDHSLEEPLRMNVEKFVASRRSEEEDREHGNVLLFCDNALPTHSACVLEKQMSRG